MAQVIDTRSQRGYVLLYSAVLGLLAMGMWALAWRAVHDTIRTEKFEVSRSVRSESVVQALALGIGLLETGRPPTDPYACIFTVSGPSTTYDCTVSYTSLGDQDNWQVESWKATDAEKASLPVAPATFES